FFFVYGSRLRRHLTLTASRARHTARSSLCALASLPAKESEAERTYRWFLKRGHNYYIYCSWQPKCGLTNDNVCYNSCTTFILRLVATLDWSRARSRICCGVRHSISKGYVCVHTFYKRKRLQGLAQVLPAAARASNESEREKRDPAERCAVCFVYSKSVFGACTPPGDDSLLTWVERASGPIVAALVLLPCGYYRALDAHITACRSTFCITFVVPLLASRNQSPTQQTFFRICLTIVAQPAVLVSRIASHSSRYIFRIWLTIAER
ncbi:unnamed protein product, partial [Ectocarpus sp. 8 AP-2014]